MDILKYTEKPAGTYFETNEAFSNIFISKISNLRLIFINSQKGPVNNIFTFEQEDFDGFKTVFGLSSYKLEKIGNYSLKVALECLEQGPIAVINLRNFSDLDIIGCIGLNSNINFIEETSAKYQSVFNTNNLWTIKPKNISENLKSDHILNIANIGSKDLSIFVVLSLDSDIQKLTDESFDELEDTVYNLEDYLGLNSKEIFKNTFVTVYVFENTFNENSRFNPIYGKLFDENGCIDYVDLEELMNIQSSKFITKITGSLIPDIPISIDNLMNNLYSETGLISYLNIELFETEQDFNLIDYDRKEFYDPETFKLKPDVSDVYLSHKLPNELIVKNIYYPPMYSFDINVDTSNIDRVIHRIIKISETEFECALEQDIKLGDSFKGSESSTVFVQEIEIIDSGNEINLRKHSREFDNKFD